jgi:hypothetical protein
MTKQETKRYIEKDKAVALEAEKKEDNDIRDIVKKRAERVNATTFAELESVGKAWEPQAESYDLSYEMTDLEYVAFYMLSFHTMESLGVEGFRRACPIGSFCSAICPRMCIQSDGCIMCVASCELPSRSTTHLPHTERAPAPPLMPLLRSLQHFTPLLQGRGSSLSR